MSFLIHRRIRTNEKMHLLLINYLKTNSLELRRRNDGAPNSSPFPSISNAKTMAKHKSALFKNVHDKLKQKNETKTDEIKPKGSRVFY